MKVVVCVALLRLCVSATAALSGNGSFADTSLTAEPGDKAFLPCYTAGSVTPSLTIWMKNGQEVMRGGGGASPNSTSDAKRLAVLENGSLSIRAVAAGDEGIYLCNSTLPGDSAFQARVLLQVASGPENVSTTIEPVRTLPNGTLAAVRGATVLLNCSGSSYPSQQLTWAFAGAWSSNSSLVSKSGSWLDFTMDDIQPSSQGVYSCVANNTVSHQTVSRSTELLVYYVPGGPAECASTVAPDLSQLHLNCSWLGAYPTPKLRWEDDRAEQIVEADGLLVTLPRSQLFSGQTLRCMAEHPALAPGKETLCSLTLNVSNRHPDCMWAPAQDPSQLQLICSWFGVYPSPKLRWEGGHSKPGEAWKGHVYLSEVTDSLAVTLEHSQLSNGQTVKCVAEHVLFAPGKETSCSFTIRPPYPKGEPLAVAVEASNVTLTCTETDSFPPANTTWRKGIQQELITPGPKYVVSVEGADVKLTIVNVSKDDQGVYFCRSQNPVVTSALEVYLTVKTSSVNTGAIIGSFIAALIVVATFAVAKSLYSHRHQVCLGRGFGHVDERGDVFNLVDSDDEQVFHDAAPQLPPISNGHHTTLVQIHRIPSSDHEDTEAAETSPEQLDDTAEAEEAADRVSL